MRDRGGREGRVWKKDEELVERLVEGVLKRGREVWMAVEKVVKTVQ